MSKILIKFLEVQAQIKIMHWQTKSYARHKAFDELYETIDGLADSFVEAFQGKYGRMMIGGQAQIVVGDLAEINLGQWIENFCGFLVSELPSELEETDTDLLNIRDEMLSSMNKLKYLLTLK